MEIEVVIDYYASNSIDTPANFISALNKTYKILETNPYYKIQYKSIRSIKIKKFPHCLFFTIKEKENLVKVLSCFHNKRDPSNRP